MTLFAKGANESLGNIAHDSGYDVLGIDWCIDPNIARNIVEGASEHFEAPVALQGNLDPTILYAGREAIDREVQRMCAAFKESEFGPSQTRAWIANLGHGITPGVDPEDMRFFLECVHKYSKE